MPARFIISRLSIIGLAPKLICRGRSPQDAENLRLFHSQDRHSPRIRPERMRLRNTRLRQCRIGKAQVNSTQFFSGTLRCNNPGTDWNWRIASMVRQKKKPRPLEATGALNWKKPKFEINIRRR
jgi:hypothetical protein